MKILICIPHFFETAPANKARYHSEREDKRQEKIRGLAKCIGILHLLFGRAHIGANHRQRNFEEVPNECAHSVTVKVVTVPEKHLLSEIGIPSRLYEHVPINADPRHIGFETHKVIRSHAGQYDYYGYLEDDIVIHDPHFFCKLDYFNRNVTSADSKALLQPNRFESFLGTDKVHSEWVYKIYPDYTYSDGPVGDVIHTLDYLGGRVQFERARAPHSGCFFVNEAQLAALDQAPTFGSIEGIDDGMVLDAAATLPIDQAFNVYKSTQRDMNFLQVEHAAPGCFDQMEIAKDGSVIWNHPWDESG